MQWDVTYNFRLRAAVFRTLEAGAGPADRTIQPSTISPDFNQPSDHGNADESWRYGFGLDWRVTNKLFVGAEATWRDLSVPVVGAGVAFEDQHEQLDRVHLYWTPMPELALSAEFIDDQFDDQNRGVVTDGGVPTDVETFSIPLAARLLPPERVLCRRGRDLYQSGCHAVGGCAGGRVFPRSGSLRRSFPLNHLTHRFPDRLGAASLEVNNLLDEQFSYQDDSFREFRD